jgi:dynein heavy chain
MMKLLIGNNSNVAFPGPTGTGKSANIYQMLAKNMGEDF